MTTVDAFPDAEALASHAIRSTVTGSRVYSSLPKNPTYPLVTVHRIGGVPAERHRLDAARIQVDVWGNSKSEAFDLAQQARVALHAMEATTYTTPVAGYVTGVADDLGLIWLPDPVTARDRYVFGVVIYLHA